MIKVHSRWSQLRKCRSSWPESQRHKNTDHVDDIISGYVDVFDDNNNNALMDIDILTRI